MHVLFHQGWRKRGAFSANHTNVMGGSVPNMQGIIVQASEATTRHAKPLTSICAFNIDHSSWKANTIVLI
jgi:hypothetical protein